MASLKERPKSSATYAGHSGYRLRHGSPGALRKLLRQQQQRHPGHTDDKLLDSDVFVLIRHDAYREKHQHTHNLDQQIEQLRYR